MKLINSARKRIDRLRVEFDKKTGFYRHERFGGYVYVRHPSHYARTPDILWVCENLFFCHYLPKSNDVVLDLGAGYGDEAMYLHAKSPGIGRYIAVEAQPVIYECLANTLRALGSGFVASPYVISDQKFVRFVSHYSYAAVGSVGEGYIEVPVMRWESFISHYNISRIDLLKMNIEGAEIEVLDSISDFSIIKRFIISCHDFRANSGDGEYFRTKDRVVSKLMENGYHIKGFTYGIDFADDWIYAERSDS